MKKSIIAAGAASLAVAAMPVVGVFADITDTVTLKVNPTCSMTGDSQSGKTVTLGTSTGQNAGTEFAEGTGTVMTISCNEALGWTLSATVNPLTASTARNIPFGSYSTSSSVWSAKIALDQQSTGTAAAIATGWDNYGASAGGTILSGAAGTAVANLQVTPTYKAYADAAQPSGTYSGAIVYAFAAVTNP